MQQIKRLYSQVSVAWQTFWPREEGVNLIIVALSMTTLLGFAGLAIDGSYAYYQNQRMQIAADAAALGGVRLLALGDSTEHARIEAEMLAVANGADPLPISAITFLGDNTEIEVTASRTFSTFFASIVGYEQMTVGASASAHFVDVVRERADHLLPVIVPCDDVASFTFGDIVALKDDKPGPGNFGWVTWDGSNSATTLANNVADLSRSGEQEIGEWIEGAPGNMNKSQVRDALDDLIESEQIVTVPLYDDTRGQGSNFDYHVCGFAQFVLTDYDKNTLWGRFVRTVARGEIPAGGEPTFGATGIRITD